MKRALIRELSSTLFSRSSFQRVGQNTNGSAAGDIGHRDLAAQRSHSMPSDREPHANPNGVLGADEGFKDFIPDLGVDSTALIFHPDFYKFSLVGFLAQSGGD